MPKPLSQYRRTKDFLNSGYLDLNSSSSSWSDFEPIKLDALADVLTSLAVEFIEAAQDNLEKAGRTASGKLADSMIPTQVEILGSTYSVGIRVADFYDFVNKGVKGWQDEKGGNSPYQFKKGYSPKMVAAIRQWVVSEGLKGQSSMHKYKGHNSMRDNQRQKLSDASSRTATSISMAVKKKGLRPSHFWDDAQRTLEQKMREQLGEALKIDIITNITNVK